MNDDASTPPDALAMFRAEQRNLLALLESTHRPAGETGAPPPEADSALHRILAELRAQLMRYCRLEEDFLHAPLADPVVPQVVANARIHCEIIRQMLDELQELHAQEDKKTEYRAAFAALADYVRQHFDTTQAILFPLARDSGLDLADLGARMRQGSDPSIDEKPAATRVPDGRLDIGSGEDHNPPPQGETPTDPASR